MLTVSDSVTQDRLDELAESDGIANALLEAAEVCAALGGVYLRITWDRSLADRPLLTSVHPDSAVPEMRWGRLSAVTFRHELTSTSATVWRHLERHSPGWIEHALYEGSPDNLGTRVPLTEHPEVADLADSLGPEGDALPTGIDRLTAAYVPNIRPDRANRGSVFGRSDYGAPLYDLFDALDTTWTSWVRDIRLARARLLVPDGYLRDHGPAAARASIPTGKSGPCSTSRPPSRAGITLSQFAIRVDEHERTSAATTRQAVQSAGYSLGTFGLDDQAAVTATEIRARDRRSMTTRKKKARYWSPELGDILYAMLLLDRAWFTPRIVPERPTVAFGPVVSEDSASLAQTLSLLQQAQAVSTLTKVQMLHPDWDSVAVQEETDRILMESGAAVPDPMQMGALA